jgi:hypothetical protein
MHGEGFAGNPAYVGSLYAHGDTVYVGGNFETAGEVTSPGIARIVFRNP